METRQAVDNLSAFVRKMIKAGIADKKQYLAWSKEEKTRQLMAKLFAYEQQGKMPQINNLVSAYFHPSRPLVLLNYTPVAHNTLHGYPLGWTPVLRQCRGIVFDFKGQLVAKPFPKFFNYGEHEETRRLPKLPFVATQKHDGHLGITFSYDHNLLLTTRGVFDSPSSKLGNTMLEKIAQENKWAKKFDPTLSPLVEMIHPQTHVLTDYDFEGFVLIGCFSLKTLEDFDYGQLQSLGQELNLPVTQAWSGKSIKDLANYMQDRSVKNQEGFVARFTNGLRVKFKFATYIGKMVEDKLSFTYLMNRMISGNLDKMLDTLPEEVLAIAQEMVGQIQKILTKPLADKEKWNELYQLVPLEDQTSYFKGICRNLVKAKNK